jgi:hypothetical protein
MSIEYDIDAFAAGDLADAGQRIFLLHIDDMVGELGAHVRKGEKGSLVVYANKITRSEQNESGEDIEREIPFLKGYTVFNVEQIDGLSDRYYAQPAPRFDPISRVEHAEKFVSATGADIRHGGGRAFYSPAQILCRCLRSRPSAMHRAITRRSCTRSRIMPNHELCRADLTPPQETRPDRRANAA